MAFALPNLIARALQILFSIIVLGLSAYVVSEYDDIEDKYSRNIIGDVNIDTPAEVHYLIFVAIWTLLVLAFLMLAPKFFPSIAHNLVILALEFVTMIFWFAGFIALAAEIDDTFCDYVSDFSGAGDECDSADAATKASIAFAALAWLTFAYTFGMGLWNFWKNRSSTGTTNPQMQQSV